MSLVPKIKICILDSCNKIDIFEQTGIYNPNNLTGWGTPNIDTDDIDTSDVSIYDKTGNTLLHKFILKDDITDVYTPVVGSPTPGPFLAVDDAEIDFGDGVYFIEYTVLENSNCETFDFYRDQDQAPENAIPYFNYIDCEGITHKIELTAFPYEYSFCGSPLPGKTRVDENTAYYSEEVDGIVTYSEQGDAAAFAAYITSTKESCGGTIYKSNCYLLNTCALENCIKNLKAKAVGSCDAEKLAKIKEQIDQLELIFYGIKSAFSCKDFDTVESLLANAKIICDNLCDCGCGDC